MKNFCRALLSATLVGNLLFMPISHAEVKTYVGVGEYIIGERDTLEVAKQGAKEKALRNALEQAGVLIQSHSRTEDSALVEDVITSRTGAILKVLEVTYDRSDLLVRATVKVDIDPDDLNHRLQDFEAEHGSQPETAAEDNTSVADRKTQEAVNLMRQGVLDGVATLLNEALQLDANNAAAYEKLGLFYKETKDFDKAVANYDKAIKLNASNEQAYRGRAECYTALGKDDKARADLATAKKVAASNEKSDEARKLFDDEQYDAASSLASEALALNPNNAAALEVIGSIYNMNKEYDKAIFYHEKAIELNPNFAEPYGALGQIYMATGKYERAIENFTKALSFKPTATAAWLYHSRGECYKALGNVKKSQADFVKAKRLGWAD